MKKIHTLALASALVVGLGGATFAQSSAPQTGQNQGGYNDKNASTKADHVDKKGSPAKAATTGASVNAADKAAGTSKDKGGAAMPSKEENSKENKAGRN